MGLFYSTFNTEDEVEKIASSLLEAELIKCCNILNSSSKSIYKWQGKVEKNSECLALFKVRDKRKEDFIKELEKIHPYDTPCIIEIKTGFINAPFNQWLNIRVT